MGNVQPGGLAAQVPHRVVHRRQTDDRHALVSKKIQFFPSAGIQTAADTWVHADHEVFQLANHLVDHGQTAVVDREHEALAGDALIGVEECQHAIGGSQRTEDRGQDRRIDRQMHDLGA